KGLQAGIRQCLQSMLEAGELVVLRVESLDSVWYSTPAQLEGLPRLRVRKSVHLLSPFDNFVIKRGRIQQLFGSEYKLECFVPAKQRRFGYFCLPILYGTELIGRLDPKADRRRAVLLIQSFQLERDVPDMERCIAELAAKLQQLAEFNDCTRVDWQPKAGDQAGHLLAQHLQG
ncbi:MAG: DNA glycosylase AlkZ-like family protein, partial [Oceanococcaceae bacterium]